MAVPNGPDEDSFAFITREDGVSGSDWDSTAGVVSEEADGARRSSVIKLDNDGNIGVVSYWLGRNGGTGTPWADDARTLSFWGKVSGTLTISVHVTVDTGSGYADGKVTYIPDTHGNVYNGGGQEASIFLDSGAFDWTDWTRFERNVEADFESVSGTHQMVAIDGFEVLVEGSSDLFWIDDLRVSNSFTSEHNILGPGVIGHILANRTWSAPETSPDQKWFHYDQVGSVMATSDSTGALSARNYQDAFGNRQEGWTGAAFSGLWDPAGGWGHNTKETDDFTNAVYMYQRWYDQTNGRFMSRAPQLAGLEPYYLFAMQEPNRIVDSDGGTPVCLPSICPVGRPIVPEFLELFVIRNIVTCFNDSCAAADVYGFCDAVAKCLCKQVTGCNKQDEDTEASKIEGYRNRCISNLKAASRDGNYCTPPAAIGSMPGTI